MHHLKNAVGTLSYRSFSLTISCSFSLLVFSLSLSQSLSSLSIHLQEIFYVCVCAEANIYDAILLILCVCFGHIKEFAITKTMSRHIHLSHGMTAQQQNVNSQNQNHSTQRARTQMFTHKLSVVIVIHNLNITTVYHFI